MIDQILLNCNLDCNDILDNIIDKLKDLLSHHFICKHQQWCRWYLFLKGWLLTNWCDQSGSCSDLLSANILIGIGCLVSGCKSLVGGDKFNADSTLSIMASITGNNALQTNLFILFDCQIKRLQLFSLYPRNIACANLTTPYFMISECCINMQV